MVELPLLRLLVEEVVLVDLAATLPVEQQVLVG